MTYKFVAHDILMNEIMQYNFNYLVIKGLNQEVPAGFFDYFLGHLKMIFDAKLQNLCVRKIPIPKIGRAHV